MSEDILPVLCARCRVEVEEAEAEPAPMAICPSCGVSDTLEAIEQEVHQFLEDHLTDDGAFEDDHQRQTDADVSPDVEPRSYRFVVDLDHLRSEAWSHAEEPAIEEAIEMESSAGGRG